MGEKGMLPSQHCTSTWIPSIPSAALSIVATAPTSSNEGSRPNIGGKLSPHDLERSYVTALSKIARTPKVALTRDKPQYTNVNPRLRKRNPFKTLPRLSPRSGKLLRRRSFLHHSPRSISPNVDIRCVRNFSASFSPLGLVCLRRSKMLESRLV